MALRNPLTKWFQGNFATYKRALELQDWEVLREFCKFLLGPKDVSLALEADGRVTAGKALHLMTKLRCYLGTMVYELDKGTLKGILGMVTTMARKLRDELDDPHWMFALCFMAFMDVNGELSTALTHAHGTPPPRTQ